MDLLDVIADGLFVSAAHDVAFEQALGPSKAVEYNFHGAPDSNDAPVDVRVTTARGVHDFPGRRIATIDRTADGTETWTWRTAITDGIDVPELHDEQPLQPGLLAAARTCAGGRPAFIAQQRDLQAVVALDVPAPNVPDYLAIARGLERSPEGLDEERALRAYAALAPVTTPVTFTDGRIESFRPGRSVRDVVADGYFLAAETQLYLEAHAAPMPRIPLARLEDDMFVWEDVPGLRRFGADYGVAAFVRQAVPVAQAREQLLVQAAMRVLSAFGLVVDGPRLALVNVPLPPLADAVRAHVLALPTPPGMDAERARRAYLEVRGQTA